MKVTLYSKSGRVIDSYECDNVMPICGDFRGITFEREPATLDHPFGQQDYIYTNMSFSVEGKLHKEQAEPLETDPIHAISMMDDRGNVINRWDTAQGLSFLKDMVTFKSWGQWHTVCGNIIIKSK